MASRLEPKRENLFDFTFFQGFWCFGPKFQMIVYCGFKGKLNSINDVAKRCQCIFSIFALNQVCFDEFS